MIFLIKFVIKFLLHGVAWVLLLSTVVNGRPLYFHARELIVDNAWFEGWNVHVGRSMDYVRRSLGADVSPQSSARDRI